MTATDPICGMQVDPATALSHEHHDQTFYFCCDHCRQRFIELDGNLPAASEHACCGETGKRSSEAAGDAATGSYHCPMCPGVASDVPGSCPKCGMALERTVISAELPKHQFVCPRHPQVVRDQPGRCPDCGTELTARAVDRASDGQELREMRWRFALAASLAVMLMMVAMGPMVGLPSDAWLGGPSNSRYLQLLLCTPIVFVAGWPLVVRAVQSIRMLSGNMFTLIGMGVAASYGYSALATCVPSWIPHAFWHGGQPAVYFESAGMIVALVLLGQVLELRARHRTTDSIRQLLALAPPVARRLEGDQVRLVALDSVQPGDHLQVLPGDRVPVDGTVTSGESFVDESMLTGESRAVRKQIGDVVTGGTVNQAGTLTMQAVAVGSETKLAQIVGLVSQAQRSRAPIQRIADRVSGWFVPAVLLAAVATFCAWAYASPFEPRLGYALVCTVAVLIIACPCALGLATPMSMTVAIGRAAREGILIRDAAILESLARVDHVIVDKTGTLTAGTPAVRRFVLAKSAGDDSPSALAAEKSELLTLAALVERQSEHPLARAIVAAADERSDKERGDERDTDNVGTIPATPADPLAVLNNPRPESLVRNVRVTPGYGLQADVGPRRVLLGSRKFLQQLRVAKLDDVALTAAAELAETSAETAVWLAIDEVAAGVFCIADPVKPTAREAIRQLRELGLRITMLSGDNLRTATAIGRELGIDEVIAEVDPRQKHDQVAAFRAQQQVVAMAGDGINDAPALTAADVGISLSTGTDIAIESAGVMLLHNDLRGLATAIKLARRTMRNIHQNLFFAFFYNGLGIPLAAGVLALIFRRPLLLNPMIAAAAMSLSSVSVITNSLRLATASGEKQMTNDK